uniref:Tudor domain-containing protein n=1 Tax=Thelazia callipaeda TaxID=103827 RepID=A0A0N5DBI3_THECL
LQGYQKVYRISPDLGYYIECQKAISQYISELATRKTPNWNSSSDSNCPLKHLPTNYEGYLACDFVQGKWYQILFKSVTRYEVYHKKVYRTFWSNHSSIYVIRPSFLIKTNYTEVNWLQKLISLKVSSISLLVHYRIRIDNHLYYMIMISNCTIHQWVTQTFTLIPYYAVHEVCYETDWPSYEHRLEHCVPFQIDNKCLQKIGAKLFACSKIYICLWMISYFTFDTILHT